MPDERRDQDSENGSHVGSNSNRRYGLFTGDELFDMPDPEYKVVVDRFLYEGDHAAVLGKSGLGKSIFVQQLAVSILSGRDFLDEFEVPKPRPILYAKYEGKQHETKSRLNRMAEGIPVFKRNFAHFYNFQAKIGTNRGFGEMVDLIDRRIEAGKILKPEVVIIDPLYKALGGDPNDNNVVQRYIDNIDMLKVKYQCSIITVHHEHKSRKDFMGRQVSETGDEASYGSTFLTNDLDHGFRIQFMPGQKRKLTLYKDRDASVVQELDLVLLSTPLMYKVVCNEDISLTGHTIQHAIRDHELATGTPGITIKELMENTSLSRRSVNFALRELRLSGQVYCVNPGEHPAKFAHGTERNMGGVL